MNRKDQHITYALRYQSPENAFDDIELLHQSVPNFSPHEVSLGTTILGHTWSVPFYINAMTGGSPKATRVNHKLAQVAQACDLIMVTGSYSAALSGKGADAYALKTDYPDLKLATNIGLDKPTSAAMRAIKAIDPLFLQVHVNVMQELLMPEGERDFSQWEQHLIDYPREISTPLMLKEVGFGMDPATIQKAYEAGFRAVDISGRGGTSFTYIENQRSTQDHSYLDQWGQVTPISLLRAKKFKGILDILASGGVRNPMDMCKAIALGADAVGLSRVFLEMVERYAVEDVIDYVNQWKQDMTFIMTGLGAKSITDLQRVPYFLYGRLREAKEQIKEIDR